MNIKTLIQLIIMFSSLSVMSIGGGNTVLSEMHHKAVDTYGWLSSSQFADVFAISQAAPGPSILIVTLIGYKAAGVTGAIIATIAMILPAALLVYFVTCFWQNAAESPIRKAVEKGLAPLTVGLVLASAYVMGRAADHDWRTYLLTAVCTVIFVTTKLNPLYVVAGAGVLGYLNWV